MKSAYILFTSVLLTFSTYTRVEAADNILLFIEGAPGESVAFGGEGAVDILGWSWGGVRSDSSLALEGLTVTKFIDSASPKLFEYFVTNQSFEANMAVSRSAGDSRSEYLRITLEGAKVTSIANSGAAGDDRAIENVTLLFGQATYAYTPQNSDGSTGTTISYTFSPDAIVTTQSEDPIPGECIDEDGDGWGWDGIKTCVP